MKKILCISNLRMDNGGIETFIMGVYRNLNTTKMKFDFLVDTSIKGYYDDEINNREDRLLHATYLQNEKLPKVIALLIQNIRFFLDLLKTLKIYGPYDVVHCHSLRLSGLSMLAAKIRKVPIRITHSHIAPKNEKKHFSWYGLINFRFSQALIKRYATCKLGCSKEACEFMYGKDSLSEKNVRVIFNGIDLDKFNPLKHDKSVAMSKYDIPSDKHILLNVGRFTKQKNQEFLLDVIKELSVNRNDFLCIIVGYGELENILKEKSKLLEIDKYIKFLPHNSDIPELLSLTDYFVLPSLYEGLGIVLIEAQAMLVKSIASTEVPAEANLGLCEFLDLRKGVKYWSDFINKKLNTQNNQDVPHVNLKDYDVKSTYDAMESIYTNQDYNF